MKKAIVIITACLIFFLPYPGLCEEALTGNINLLLGSKSFENEDGEYTDNHLEYGIMMDFKGKRWPINIAIDFIRSENKRNINDYMTFTSYDYIPENGGYETSELNLGLRKYWMLQNFSPFLEGGVSYFEAVAEKTFVDMTGSKDDRGVGMWAGCGLNWRMSSQMTIGLNIKWSRSDVTLQSIDIEAGGFHYGMLFGFIW